MGCSQYLKVSGLILLKANKNPCGIKRFSVIFGFESARPMCHLRINTQTPAAASRSSLCVTIL